MTYDIFGMPRETNTLPSYQDAMVPRPKSRKTSLLIGIQILILINTIVLVLMAIIPADFTLRSPLSRCHHFWSLGSSNPVVVLSFNGFRYNHIDLVRKRFGLTALPNFAQLEQSGLRAERLISVYPPLTLPTHRTLLTGLYPQHHGAVCDRFIDRNYPNITFDCDDQTSLNNAPWTDDWPEPVWATLQRYGGLSGTVLWPLTDRPFQGNSPFMQVSQFAQGNTGIQSYSFEQRERSLVQWLNSSLYKLDLIMAYFNQPIHAGQTYGPDSDEVIGEIVRLDSLIGRLLGELDRLGLKESVNLIVTSGHGMSATSSERVIALDKFINSNDYITGTLSAIGMIYPKPGQEEKIYTRLRSAHKHMRVYRLEDTPKWLHFNHSNSRMAPIILIADAGWTIVHSNKDRVQNGSSGYDSTNSDMDGVLLATGPAFRINQTVKEVHLIDIYSLLCALTNTRANPNNGSLERIASTVLKPQVARQVLHPSFWTGLFCFRLSHVILLVGLFLVCYNVWALYLMYCMRPEHRSDVRRIETRSIFSGYDHMGKIEP